jgi:hypothetical protein
MYKLAVLLFMLMFAPAFSPRVAYAAQLTENIDEPGRNPWQQTRQTQINTGDCHSGLCVVIFKDVPKGKRLVLTYASALFEGSTALGVGVVDASVSNTVPGIPGSVIVQVPGLSAAGKSGNYQAGGHITLYVDQGQSPVMVLEGASGTVRATASGYLVTLKP